MKPMEQRSEHSQRRVASCSLAASTTFSAIRSQIQKGPSWPSLPGWPFRLPEGLARPHQGPAGGAARPHQGPDGGAARPSPSPGCLRQANPDLRIQDDGGTLSWCRPHVPKLEAGGNGGSGFMVRSPVMWPRVDVARVDVGVGVWRQKRRGGRGMTTALSRAVWGTFPSAPPAERRAVPAVGRPLYGPSSSPRPPTQYTGLFLLEAPRLWPLRWTSPPKEAPVETKQQNILILMSDTGGGHRASAQALQAGFKEMFGDKYKVCAACGRWLRRVVRAWRLLLGSAAGVLWAQAGKRRCGCSVVPRPGCSARSPRPCLRSTFWTSGRTTRRGPAARCLRPTPSWSNTQCSGSWGSWPRSRGSCTFPRRPRPRLSWATRCPEPTTRSSPIWWSPCIR